MKAYAIFDGGGVLGAALAGCFAAAREPGSEVGGVGGTSAGSIVALLGSVGYDGNEMENFLVETNFTEFLDESGTPVEIFKRQVSSVLSEFENARWWKPWKPLRACGKLNKLVGRLSLNLGVDDGETLKQLLIKKIGEKHDRLAKHANITFNELLENGCAPLKIVASDMTKRSPVVFSADQNGYGDSVLDAVRASTCYPFVFQPFRMNGRCLVDGGLASNLPAFLFHTEYQQSGFPVFAFDLTVEDSNPPATLSLKEYLLGMVSTALDAGDELMRYVLKDVIHVPIPIPSRFSVLDFQMNREQRAELFNIGFREATRQLNELEFLKIIKTAGDALQKKLQSRYGSILLYKPVLAALAREVESTTNAKRVRAHIMLPTGRQTRIVTYSYGMDTEHDDGRLTYSTDYDLEIPEGAGCSGRAWTEKAPTAADLVEAASNPSAWGMTPEQHGKVPKDRKSMLSVPIRSYSEADTDDENLPVVGTLSIDSSTPLADTSWMEGSDVQSELVTRVVLWENVVRRLLRKRHP